MPPTIEQVVEEVERSEISSTRAVLSRILEVISNPHSSAFDLKEMIERDPPLAARVLKRANSAYYGCRRQMVEILEAIVCIGFEAVKELVLSQSVCELFMKDDVMHGYSRPALWVHCVGVALCGKLIYRREFQMSGEQIYTAGLLHDLGLIVEDQFLREHFSAIMADFHRAPQPGLYFYEREKLGFSHAAISAALARNWNFPEPLCQALGVETMPEAWTTSDALLSASLGLARWACQQRGIGFVETPHVDRQIVRDSLHRLNVTERGLDFIMDTVETQIKQMRNEGWF